MDFEKVNEFLQPSEVHHNCIESVKEAGVGIPRLTVDVYHFETYIQWVLKILYKQLLNLTLRNKTNKYHSPLNISTSS